jgi:hypothetical protein
MAVGIYPLTGKNTKKESKAGIEILRSILKAELFHVPDSNYSINLSLK